MIISVSHQLKPTQNGDGQSVQGTFSHLTDHAYQELGNHASSVADLFTYGLTNVREVLISPVHVGNHSLNRVDTGR